MKHKSITALFMSFTLIAIFLISVGGIVQAALPQQTINTVYVTNVWEGGFMISWTTDTPGDGHVDYDFTDPAAGITASDEITSTTTHYVEVEDLSANTTYLFQIRSGGTTDDNGGAFYSVTTGISLGGNPDSHNLWGYLYASDGTTPVPNAVVYMQTQDGDGSPSPGNSAWASARTNSDGLWYYNLLNIRTVDGSGRFIFNEGMDNIRLIWQGGILGAVGEAGDEDIRLIPPVNTQIDVNLDDSPAAAHKIYLPVVIR